MEVLVVQIFVSLLLVTGGVLALAYSLKQSDHEHADRLSILPLDEERVSETPDARSDRGAKNDHV